ncbi:MAG: TetR/AcrR family transcriptional regulator [Bacteroidia bacterium]|nr:TetR/AcrR family transcriptional regulator [Bacteroidia bacterium]
MAVHGLRLTLPEKLFLKDPQDSSYGKRLLEHTVILMERIGFESFTFKKLAKEMDSAETSIYRYFENKHFVLLYLNCWYWEWVHYLIDINTRNILDPVRKLEILIHNLIFASEESTLTNYINESLLHKIIVLEGTKSYHIHNVDQENEVGLFMSYKNLTKKMASIVEEAHPGYPYPRSLCSTLFEMVNSQIYYAEHLPRLTDIKDTSSKSAQIESMAIHMVKSMLHLPV